MAAGHDEEYHFSELEGADIYGSEPENEGQKSSGEGGDNLKRNIVILIGVLILIFAAYKMVGVYFGEKQQTITPLPAPVMQAPIKQQPTPSTEKWEPTQFQTLQNRVRDALQQESSMRTNQIQQLQNNLSELKAVQNDLMNKLNDLSAQLKMVSDNLDKKMAPPPIQAPMVIQKPKVIHRAIVHQPKEPAFARSVYTIQAIIPGRAWLSSDSGASLTVSLGSEIPGLGQVRYIDASRGRLVTSDGTVIKFNLGE